MLGADVISKLVNATFKGNVSGICSERISGMDGIGGNAVAGLIAALAATTILGVGKWIRLAYLRQLDVKYLREVITDGRRRVMGSKDTFNHGMNAPLTTDVLRSGQYNLMIKQLMIILDHTTSKLSHDQRKDVFDALDWYHTQSLHAVKDKHGKPVFVDLPVGRWPTMEMQESRAVDKFKRLESIKWLKLKPHAYGHSENS